MTKSSRSSTDWDTISRKLKIPPRVIAAHTEQTNFLRLDWKLPRD